MPARSLFDLPPAEVGRYDEIVLFDQGEAPPSLTRQWMRNAFEGISRSLLGAIESSFDPKIDDPAAEQRSIELLRASLNPQQRIQFDERSCFDVRGSAGGRYLIRFGRTFNIDQLVTVGDQLQANLCVQPVGAPWTGDVMLAQKIMLENDERGTLKVANRGSVIAYGGCRCPACRPDLYLRYQRPVMDDYAWPR